MLSHVIPVSCPTEADKGPERLFRFSTIFCSPVSDQREAGREPDREVPHKTRLVSAPRPPMDAGMLPPPKLDVRLPPHTPEVSRLRLLTLSTPSTALHVTPVQAPPPVVQGSVLAPHQFCSKPCFGAGTEL